MFCVNAMKWFLVYLSIAGLVDAYYYDSGYPQGFMADCPGMNRSTTFSPKTIQSLTVAVHWPSSGRFSFDGGHKKCKLSKESVGCIAKYLDFKKKTKVLISGYMDTTSILSPFMRAFSGIELERGRNVLILETFPVLFRPYPLAARTTKPLGHHLGEFLARLTQRGVSPDKLEIVGGSLGAHIGYHAAMRFYELTGQKIARLTGLDPAGPCFRNLPLSERFNPAAARRVDALHTNTDGLGIAEPVGHIDFYANGGEFQPSMSGNFLLPCFTLCSHMRAAWYWVSANRNPDQFIGIKCDSIGKARHGDCYQNHLVTNTLGSKTNFTRRGVYFLPVSETSPYYVGKEALKKSDYGINNYLTKTAPDTDIVL